MLLPSLLGPVQAAHLLITGFWVPPPFSCRYVCSSTCGSLHIQTLSLTCRWHWRRENRVGGGVSAQFILSKNVHIPSASRPCPESSRSTARWLSSLAGEWRCWWGGINLLGVRGIVFRWQEKHWSKEHVFLQALTHWEPAWICYLGPSE